MSQQNLSRRTFLESGALVAVTVAVPTWLIARDARAAESSKKGKDSPKAAEPKKNPAWEARAKELEAQGPLYTAAEPGKWKGKEGGHVPSASFEGNQVTVVTKHPMKPEHFITTHYVKNQTGTVIALHEFTGTDPEAKSAFTLPQGTTAITVYSHCNLHDLWTAPTQKA